MRPAEYEVSFYAAQRAGPQLAEIQMPESPSDPGRFSPTNESSLGAILSDVPVSDVDLFTPEARVDPYPIYEELRALGPVVHLSRYDLYALARYEQVRAALMDWKTFTSARGVFVDPP